MKDYSLWLKIIMASVRHEKTGSLCLVRKILFLVLIDEMTEYYAELAHFTAVRNKKLSENIQWSHIKCTRTKASLPDDKTRNNYSLPDNFATRFLNKQMAQIWIIKPDVFKDVVMGFQFSVLKRNLFYLFFLNQGKAFIFGLR